MFFIGRAKAHRLHWAGTPVDNYLELGEAFAKPRITEKMWRQGRLERFSQLME
jgi:hypothetical protein